MFIIFENLINIILVETDIVNFVTNTVMYSRFKTDKITAFQAFGIILLFIHPRRYCQFPIIIGQHTITDQWGNITIYFLYFTHLWICYKFDYSIHRHWLINSVRVLSCRQVCWHLRGKQSSSKLKLTCYLVQRVHYAFWVQQHECDAGMMPPTC